MDRPLRWDDLRIVLAIAEAGSLAGAGRQLGVSHATVFRRLDGLEERLGVRLFERLPEGYAPTPAGEDLAAAARRVETEVLEAERRVQGRDLMPSGTVRVTTTDTLYAGLLAPVLAGFRREHPAITLEVTVSNRVHDLSRRDADIAIRPSDRPPEALVGRRLGRLRQAVYGAAGAGQAAALAAADWIGPDDTMGYRTLERWMAATGYAERCVLRLDSVLAMATAVRCGSGIAVLPCYLADADPGLRRLGEPVEALATDLWLLTHADLRHTTRIRALLDHVAAALAGKPL